MLSKAGETLDESLWNLAFLTLAITSSQGISSNEFDSVSLGIALPAWGGVDSKSSTSIQSKLGIVHGQPKLGIVRGKSVVQITQPQFLYCDQIDSSQTKFFAKRTRDCGTASHKILLNKHKIKPGLYIISDTGKQAEKA